MAENRGQLSEGRILLAKAELSEARGDIEESLAILRDISPSDLDNFIKSRDKMASLYLKYRKDRRLYASCYREILDKNPTTLSHMLLGDAYMNILEVCK